MMEISIGIAILTLLIAIWTLYINKNIPQKIYEKEILRKYIKEYYKIMIFSASLAEKGNPIKITKDLLETIEKIKQNLFKEFPEFYLNINNKKYEKYSDVIFQFIADSANLNQFENMETNNHFIGITENLSNNLSILLKKANL